MLKLLNLLQKIAIRFIKSCFTIFAKIFLRMIDLDYLAFLENILTEKRKERFLEVLKNRTNHFTIAIEDVYQLHNTSAVMRSCEVFGIQELNVIEEKFGKRIDKEIAMGAQKWVDVNRFNAVQDCIDTLKGKGYQIIATTPHNDSCLIHEFDISKKSALFFGTERDGLSQEIIDQADGYLKIPMVGFTESLNLSVSAAIILHHLTSKLKGSTIGWQLSPAERSSLKLEWLRRSIRSSDLIEKEYHNRLSGG